MISIPCSKCQIAVFGRPNKESEECSKCDLRVSFLRENGTDIPVKECPSCHDIKALTKEFFSVDKSRSTGFRHVCKPCDSILRASAPKTIKKRSKIDIPVLPDTPGIGLKTARAALARKARPQKLSGVTYRFGTVYITINNDAVGPFELFLNSDKLLPQIQALARLVSIAWRSGCDSNSIINALQGYDSYTEAIAQAIKMHTEGE